MEAPVTRYAHTSHGDVAYQVFGEGPDLLLVNPMSRSIQVLWDFPPMAHVLAQLGRGRRVILFDRRGSGISDPLPIDLPPTWEDWLDDISAVLDDLRVERAALLAERDSASASMLFATSHPERVSALVLCNTSARLRVAPGYPVGVRHEQVEAFTQAWAATWGTEKMVASTRQQLVDNPAYVRWVMRMQRVAYTPRRAGEEFAYIVNFDARSVLTAINVPTLVLHRRDFAVVPLAHGEYLAAHITRARLEILEGRDMDVLVPGDEVPLRLIGEFLSEKRAQATDNRVLATVVFGDIPDAARLAVTLGGGNWKSFKERQSGIVHDAVQRFSGTQLSRGETGFSAQFDGPRRAINFARALRRDLRELLHLEIRMAVHAGEFERGQGALDGDGARTAAAMLAAAQPSEVLASLAAKDLLEGSGVELRELGRHRLQGVPGEWELFALAD